MPAAVAFPGPALKLWFHSSQQRMRAEGLRFLCWHRDGRGLEAKCAFGKESHFVGVLAVLRFHVAGAESS